MAIQTPRYPHESTPYNNVMVPHDQPVSWENHEHGMHLTELELNIWIISMIDQ